KKDYFGRDLPNEFVLFQGRLAYYKGLDVLLNAYLNLKEQGYSSENIPKLIISGDGDLKEFMLNYIADNNLENYIYPLCRFVSNDEKAWLFKKC
ncbi:glycosyltransferase, partial [Vibrio parahaemolyticus]|uniref:glycosyltransferase n=1 Tax=Vibrio parahaemolyticus TaxID=670 RepID=UPI00111E3FA4